MNLSQILEVASHTDPGMVRSHNEDSIASDAASGLVVLADAGNSRIQVLRYETKP